MRAIYIDLQEIQFLPLYVAEGQKLVELMQAKVEEVGSKIAAYEGSEYTLEFRDRTAPHLAACFVAIWISKYGKFPNLSWSIRDYNDTLSYGCPLENVFSLPGSEAL